MVHTGPFQTLSLVLSDAPGCDRLQSLARRGTRPRRRPRVTVAPSGRPQPRGRRRLQRLARGHADCRVARPVRGHILKVHSRTRPGPEETSCCSNSIRVPSRWPRTRRWAQAMRSRRRRVAADKNAERLTDLHRVEGRVHLRVGARPWPTPQSFTARIAAEDAGRGEVQVGPGVRADYVAHRRPDRPGHAHRRQPRQRPAAAIRC